MQQGRVRSGPGPLGPDRTVVSRGEVPGSAVRDDEAEVLRRDHRGASGEGALPAGAARRRFLHLLGPALRPAGPAGPLLDKGDLQLSVFPGLQAELDRPFFRTGLLLAGRGRVELILELVVSSAEVEGGGVFPVDVRGDSPVLGQEHQEPCGVVGGG